MSVDSLYIPVQGFNEVVVVPFEQMPDYEEILDVLMSECAPLSMWMECAKAYLSQNKTDQYVSLLSEGTSKDVADEVEKFFGYKPRYEQIQFCCGLAAYHITKAREEKDRAKKNEFFVKANTYLNQAKQIDPNEQLPFLASGYLSLAKGETDTARREFAQAIERTDNKRPNIAGLLAMAALHFNQGQYSEALALYRRALLQHPGAPAEVRLGLAACHFRLGDFPRAEAAYQRVLQLDPSCSDAYLGLAIIAFNSTNVQQGLADGLKMLEAAYQLDPSNTAVLVMLAHMCLLRGDFHSALAMSRAAYEAAEADALRAECLTLIGRAHHALGALKEAMTSYVQASRLDARLPLPHLGLAQMYLQQGEYRNAASELESVLSIRSNCYDALMILGNLYSQMPAKVEKTISHFQETAAKRPEDAELWETMAELLSPSDPAASLNAYKRALEIQRRRQAARTTEQEAARKKAAAQNGDLFGDDDDLGQDGDEGIPPPYLVPARLLNNAAVLMFRAGDVPRAMDLMQEATRNMMTDDGSGLAPMHKVTLGYNMARLQEASGDLKAAETGYQAILKLFPGYTDCYLRLGCIARATGNIPKAVEWTQQAIDNAGGDADALAQLGMLHLERREYPAAKEVLDKLVKGSSTKEDVYGQLGLANLYFYTAPSDRRKPDAEKKAEQHFTKALEHYRAVLKKEKRNIYAANGVGAALAEQGLLDAAKQVFGLVQEAAVASGGFLRIPDVAINLANINLAKQEYVSAVKLYQSTSAKFYHNKNAQVLLFLSRAYYDSDDLANAKRCLLKAIHVAPTDHKLRFNVALTMQEWSVRVLKKKRGVVDLSKADEFKQAVGELEQALRIFEHLKAMGQGKTTIDKAKLDTHVAFCTETLSKAKVHAEQAELEAQGVEARRMKQKAELENQAALGKRRELEVEAKKKVEAEALKTLIDANRQRTEELRRSMLVSVSKKDEDGERKRSKGSGRKSKAGGEEADFIADEEEAEGGPEEEGVEQEPAQDDEDAEGAGDEEGAADDGEQEAPSTSGRGRGGGATRKRRLAVADAEEEGEQAAEEGELIEDVLEDEAEEAEAPASARGPKRLRRQVLEDDEGEEGEAPPQEAAQMEVDDDDLFGDADDE